MKREIKFRGLPTCKEKDELDYINFDRDGNFAVGFYEDGYIIGKVADASDDYISPEFWVAVDKNTVGQYTGLQDKNGKDIYEGDVVSISNHPFQKHKGSLTGIDIEGNYEINWSERDLSWLAGVWKCSETRHYLTVIGNIHENPELLEVEDENK